MTLSFTVLNKRAQVRNYSLPDVALEAALDIVNLILSDTDIISDVYFTDDYGVLKLPVEIFNGEPFLAPIHQLEQQWRHVLKQPKLPVSSASQWARVTHR